ncbi:MAG: ShlB/FhaC/HecB family hemolysin secretion/activation protein [Telluria sp.]
MRPALHTSAILMFAASTACAQPQTVLITGVRVEGNTLLPESALRELTAGVAGTEQSLAQLNALAARIQHAYRDAGYGGVVAFIPAQEETQGHILVRVVEGRLVRVRVTGNAHFDTANVRAGLPNLREGETPRVPAIDRDIQLSNHNPAKQVNVTLGAGSRPGDIDAEVRVTDSRPVQILAGYNNTGTGATGRHRLSIGLVHANLFGRDHVATLQYQTSPGHPDRVRIASAGYRVPLYARAASIDAFVARSTVSNGTTATTAGPLSFTGRGTIAGLRANRHLGRRGEYDHYVTLGLDWRDYDDDCAIGDFGAAGCGSAAVDVNTVPLVVSYTGQKEGARLAYGVHAAVSANGGGSAQPMFEAARPGAKRHYVLARLSGFVEKPMAAGSAINARLELQYSPHRLIAAEKYGIGGAGSVRGYAERETSGDSGFLARIEVLAAAPQWGGLRLRPYLFADYGRVFNHGDMPCRAAATSCSLRGAGLGARLAVGKSATASIDAARALAHGTATAKGDARAHVALQLVF